MRPVRLSMQAFGPYADRAVVDFREAVASGLFGIYGPTGSGKSSIFSAMTCALFGEAASAEQDTTSLRSDHADPDIATEVEFIFDIGSNRYVLRRRPEQARRKQRGEGETRDSHEAWLFDATGLAPEEITEANPGKIIAEKKTGLVKEAVTQLLGYGAEQFRQIVLLPQGKFETFMASKTDKRLEILRELFDVSIYQRMAAKFKADALAAEKLVRQDREVCAKRLVADGFVSPEALAEGIEEANAAHQAAVLRETAAALAASTAKVAYDRAHQLNEQFCATEQASSIVEGLVAKAEHIQGLEERVTHARCAQSLTDIEKHSIDAQAEVVEAAMKMANAATTDETAAAKALAAQTALDHEVTRAEESESLRRAGEKLDHYQQTLTNAAAQAEKATEASTALENARNSLDLIEAHHEELRNQKIADERALKLAREGDATRQQLNMERSAAERTLIAAEQYQTAAKAVEQARSEMAGYQNEEGRSAQKVAEAKGRFEVAEAALADAQALHLAAKLVPGEACLVCGSLEHPAPATGKFENVGLDQAFRDAKANLEKNHAAHQLAVRNLASAETKWLERKNRLAESSEPEQSVDEVRGKIAVLASQIDAIGPAIDLLEAEAKLAKLGEEITSTESERDSCRSNHETANTQEALARDRFDQAIGTIPEGLRLPDALTEAIAENRRQRVLRDAAMKSAEIAARETRDATLAAGKELEAANAAQESAVFRRDKALAAFEGRLTQSGLTSAQYQFFKKLIGTIEEDVAEIAEYRNNLLIARNNHQVAAQIIEGYERPEMGAIEKTLREASDELDHAKTACAQAEARWQRLEALLLDIAGELRRLDQIETETASLRSLAALFNAENPLRLDLETYAIGAMFDQVLTAANQRLGPMTGGRFSLEREVEGGNGRSRRGLGIRVFDVHTGKTRPTSTLSGGETFMAALALALGLSDIVESVSGQVRLDTIFIDEGFGSLDTENESGTLDQVLHVLTNLVGPRRVVGLISHVPLVQETIPNGFYVRKELRGSFIEARGVI